MLRLIAAGMTNNEIAAELFLSAKTVSRHLSNIFTKIGVSTRAGGHRLRLRAPPGPPPALTSRPLAMRTPPPARWCCPPCRDRVVLVD